MKSEAVWTFETARYRIALEIVPEDMDPADSFESAEDIEAIHNGTVEWFQAMVAVYLKATNGPDIRIGYDTLGACAYATVREFYTAHRDPDPMNRNCSIMRGKRGDNVFVGHYFPDMVAQAVKDARANIARLCEHH